MHRENHSMPPPGKYPTHNNPGYAKPQIVQDIQITQGSDHVSINRLSINRLFIHVTSRHELKSSFKIRT